MRSVRFIALASIAALVLTVLPPSGHFVVHASPQTLTETLTDLPEAASDDAPQVEGFSTAQRRAPGLVSRSEATTTPLTFNMMGVTAPQSATAVRARTFDGERWSSWLPLAFVDAEDGPDTGTAEDRGAAPGRATEPLWVGEATRIQLEVEGAEVGELETHLIDSMGSSGGPMQRTVETRPAGATADASDLQIVSRAEWGANESLRGDSTPSYAREIHMGIVHHTAHSPDATKANGYTRAEAPAVMRAMYQYHTQTLGWSDLGYNVVVDRFGTVYEGRAGGFERPVIGAHARGFNTGSFGVSVMGNFVDVQAPAVAIEALTEVVGLKSAIHGLDPTGWNDRMGDGSWRSNIVGHRDVGQTSCPGRISQLLPQIRDDASGMAVRFPDVSSSSPHRSAIINLAQDGIAAGCRINEFCPKSGLSRAQASSFVLRTFELDPILGTSFSDVDFGGAHTGAINALSKQGWLRGYGDGTFGPWDQVTRGQLASLLALALELPTPVPDTAPYPDVSRHSTHAAGIAALKEVGIEGNCGSGRFCANDIALRDSTASFLEMARQYKASLEPDEPDADVITEDGATDDGTTDDGTTDDGTTDDGTGDGSTTDDGTTDDGTSGASLDDGA